VLTTRLFGNYLTVLCDHLTAKNSNNRHTLNPTPFPERVVCFPPVSMHTKHHFLLRV